MNNLISERIYVSVTSHFDIAGYMQPEKIIWKDGREFPIDAVKDYSPASRLSGGLSGDCYTIVIKGEEKHLFFERSDNRFAGHFGRWFVEAVQSGACARQA